MEKVVQNMFQYKYVCENSNSMYAKVVCENVSDLLYRHTVFKMRSEKPSFFILLWKKLDKLSLGFWIK